LDAYERVIIQFVSDFFMLLVYTLPSVFLILHSVLKEIYFFVFKMCPVIMTRSVLLLQHSSCFIMNQENNFGLHQFCES